MTPPVVVFAVGNPSRGDDALGPLLAVRFADFLEETGGLGEFEIVEDFQLQVEHALDLQGRALALFVDAGIGTPAPYEFKAIRPAGGYGHTTHALEPEAVLQVFQQTEDTEPPPAYVLCVRGESFELGDDLTPQAANHLEAALGLMQELARGPSAEAWSRIAEKDQR